MIPSLLGVELLRLLRRTPLWIFFATLAIQSIPFNPIPNVLPLAAYVARHAEDPLGLYLSVALSALGAVLGKLVVLRFGSSLRALMPARSREAFKKLLEMVPRDRLDLAVFAIAASPLPDDEVYLLLGAGGYSTRRLTAVLIPAKALWAATHLAYALATYRAVKLLAGDAAFWAYAVSISALTLALTAAALRLDWAAVLDAYRYGGIKSAVAAGLKSALSLRRNRPRL